MAGGVEGVGVGWGRIAYAGDEDGPDNGHRVSRRDRQADCYGFL